MTRVHRKLWKKQGGRPRHADDGPGAHIPVELFLRCPTRAASPPRRARGEPRGATPAPFLGPLGECRCVSCARRKHRYRCRRAYTKALTQSPFIVVSWHRGRYPLTHDGCDATHLCKREIWLEYALWLVHFATKTCGERFRVFGTTPPRRSRCSSQGPACWRNGRRHPTTSSV